MRSRWLLLALILCGFRPVYNKHDTFEKVDTELIEMQNAYQEQKFTVNATTPNVVDMRDQSFEIVATTGQPQTVNLVLRIGTTMYVSPNWKLIQGR